MKKIIGFLAVLIMTLGSCFGNWDASRKVKFHGEMTAKRIKIKNAPFSYYKLPNGMDCIYYSEWKYGATTFCFPDPDRKDKPKISTNPPKVPRLS